METPNRAALRRPRAARLLLLLATLPVAGMARDMTGLSLEELLEVEVISASKYPQRMADAPAAVTVLRAADIRLFGYRTLADILRSVRGFYVSSDHQYEHIGVRGFSPPGDYNTRLLVLVDGYRVNDNIYDTGAIGGEFPLDVDLIDRVEIVRGPGSSVYGGNALFGVVNVITRRGRDLAGGEAVAGVAADSGGEGRLSWGRRLDSGLEVLFSASGLSSEGGTLRFPEFDGSASSGVTHGTDYERRRQLLGKLEYGGWSLTLMNSRRDKGLPGGAYGTDFDERGNHIVDRQTSVNLAHFRTLEGGAELSARLYTGSYAYRGYYVYSGAVNQDTADGAWWGGEIRLAARHGRHQLVYGAEYQNNRKQAQGNFDRSPNRVNLADRRSDSRTGVYFQDDYALAERWTLSAGLRHDYNSRLGGHISPRLGVIHETGSGSVLKLLYGSAYRSPNAYERHYAYPGQQLANPDLNPERIQTYEAVWEKTLGQQWHLAGSIYYYRIRDWIVQQADPASGQYQFVNLGPISARGLEVEAERQWPGGTRLRASYSLQIAPERVDGSLNQAPRHLFKVALARALWQPEWRAGLEGQYMGRRSSISGRIDDHTLVNATLQYVPRDGGPQLALSLYNLFDQHYLDPNVDPGVPGRESIELGGRSWRLRLTMPF